MDYLKVATAEQMRRIEAGAIEELAIPSIVLMENAALAVMELLDHRFGDAQRAVIFCGTGMNGGDGLAVARHLTNRGTSVDIVLLGEEDACRGDARTNLEICRRSGIPIHIVRDVDALSRALALPTDLIIDAIFGTGLARPAVELHARCIEAINEMLQPVVSIDIPSGLNASESQCSGPAISADVTVTFSVPKICHVLSPAAEKCGEVVVADISIPSSSVDRERIALSLISPADVSLIVGERDRDSHKGTYGHVAIVAGSPGKSGAAILAARGALRGGAGLITVVTDRESAQIVDSVSIESMSYATQLSAATCGDVAEMINDRMSAAVIGPGLGDHESSYAVIRMLVATIDCPLVIDASGLNAFAARGEELNTTGGSRVITPHPGELSRLMNVAVAEVQNERMSMARRAAELTKCVVVLKGHQTIVADPDGELAVNTTGNPGMATGGMGDVLSGLIAALLARGESPWDAARAAVYLHGRAGDLLADEYGETGLAAMDLADRIPAALRGLVR
ncbi:MAG TPA: NAD(P)H-hydrate dehydratase [Thermoanaerobaculia bacterium]|nr:NAD(P)H-hydrate dehydratase [Thermoanaerobaculia bacterium]